jgi:uncharacterized protein YgbK (DUF1537 family)
MLLGVIADDFTGASDIANTLARGLPGQGGLRVAQFMGTPRQDADAEIEAGVVSLKSRSNDPTEAVAQSMAALHWLLGQGCSQIVFKYCSTFDSTPQGNIGPVAEALAVYLKVGGVIVCPAFPTVGRTVHQGHLFVHDRLLSESGMQNHPLTPMTDPDLRRWLMQQTKGPVGLVACQTVRQGSASIQMALVDAASRGETLVVADAATDDDLLQLAAACADARLVTGGSAIALGLPRNFIQRGLASGQSDAFVGVGGHEAILVGSCSGATRRQIAVHAKDHPIFSIDIDGVMAGRVGAEDLVAFLVDNRGAAPLVYSSDDPDAVATVQQRHGRNLVAHRLDALFADTARALVQGGVKRLVVAGGETSSAVAMALGFDALRIGPEIDPGVPVLTNVDGTVALALKSGNFGSADFFAKALERMKNP